jgi:Zn-finger nucleic acid-binding protein
MTIPQLRHVMGERMAAKILRLMKLAGGVRSPHACPFCAGPMIPVETQEPPLQLETCRTCNAIWLDFPTYESLPQITEETMNSMQMQATEIIAINRLRELKEKQEKQEAEAKKKKKRRLLGPRDDDTQTS